jgi:hypothetical protein
VRFGSGHRNLYFLPSRLENLQSFRQHNFAVDLILPVVSLGRDAGIHFFRSLVLGTTAARDKLVSALLKLIDGER